MHARDPTLLPAMLASVASDLATLRCADMTPDGPARRWLEAAGLKSVADPEVADLVVCDANELGMALARCAPDGLILARSSRGCGVEGATGASVRSWGLVRTSAVRDADAQWELLARVAPIEAAPAEAPAASIVVVTRDEARSLLRLLTILAVDEGPWSWELVVVDRSSFDATAALLRAVEGDLRVVSAPRSLPRAEAFSLGFAHSRGQLLVGIDLDYVPSASFVQAVLEASSRRPHLRAWTGPLLDGPTGRTLNPEAVGRPETEMASPELFALSRHDWSSTAWRGDVEGVRAALATFGPAGVAPRFRARRPGPYQSGICL